jgi:anti-sigma regulatory factor (Ser/Thr protein kinase)
VQAAVGWFIAKNLVRTMTKATQLLALQIPAQTAYLCTLRQKLREVLDPFGGPEDLINCIVLAVNEACMNIIQHAYGKDEQGDIILEVELQGDCMTFRLTDFAKHKTRAEEMCPRSLEDLRPGGLGCHLISTIMDEVQLIDCGSRCGNVLQMKKSLS